MPRFDGTGPMGQGPMTGRGMGPCNPNARPGYGRGYGQGRGRGMGQGYGRGRGRGFCWYNPWRWFNDRNDSGDQNQTK